MANKKFLLIILAIVLVFGMAVVGCDNDSTDDKGGNNNSGGDVFNGTAWKVTYSGTTITLKFESPNVYQTGDNGALALLGTYTASGNTATITIEGTPTTATMSGNTLTYQGVTYTKDTSGGNPVNPGGGGEGGTFTITGIPAELNGKYIRLTISGLTTYQSYACQSINVSTDEITPCLISNGNVSLPMWTLVSTTPVEFVRYTGNGTANNVLGYIYNSQTNKGTVIGGISFTSATFTNGSATKSWSDGQYVANPNAP